MMYNKIAMHLSPSCLSRIKKSLQLFQSISYCIIGANEESSRVLLAIFLWN